MTKQKRKRERKLKRGQKVVLKVLPPGLIDGLPEEDQRAISAVVGKAAIFEGYGRDGIVELEFMESNETIHSVWVKPKYIKPWRASSVRRHLWNQPLASFSGRRRKERRKKLTRGRRIILQPLPPEVIDTLPMEDQQLMSAVVGRPFLFFNRYERDGSAELELVDSDNTAHLIYVDPRLVKLW